MAKEAKLALHVLAAGLVVDRSVLVTQTSAEITSLLDLVRATPKRSLLVIENANTFFTSANMLELIKANDDAYKLIAEKAKVTLRDDDVMAIRTAEVAKKAIEATMVPPVPPYPFAIVPTGYDVTKTFELCQAGRAFRRIGRTESIGLGQGELIWRYLSAYWVNGKAVESKYFRDNRVFVEGDYIRVGCQRARRYEIEQIALWQGWKFPEAAK